MKPILLANQPTRWQGGFRSSLRLFTNLRLFIGMLCCLAPGYLKAQCFQTTTYAVGGEPASMAVGDVNADGRIDLVTANLSDNTVSVLLGLAGGGFADQSTYAVGGEPYSVAVGDVNADGRIDLVTANGFYNTVSVLLGLAGGGFASPTTYGVGIDPYSVAVGDVNADGRADIIAANRQSYTVSVLLGLAGGGFADQSTYGVGGEPASVVVRDVNADGRTDIVTANLRDNTVSVLLGLAGGGFADQSTYGVGSGPYSVAVGDVNADGRADIVTANFWANTVSVLLGLAGGGFANQTPYAVGNGPYSVAVGDVNADGRADIIAADLRANTVSVLLGLAGGGFADQSTYGVGGEPASVVVRDVNADGRTDIVTANLIDNTVSVLQKTVGPPTLMLTNAVAPTRCDSPDGLIQFSTNLPDGSYSLTYRKNGGASQSVSLAVAGGSLSLTGLSGGSYAGFSIAITGCAGTSDAVINFPNAPAPSVSISSSATAICASQSAQLTASGATSYSWNTGQTTSSVSVTASGTYSVTGLASNGCSATANASVTVNAPPPAGLSNNGPLTCLQTSVTLTASGGSSYTFTDGNGTILAGSGNTRSVSNSSTYSVRVGNTSGCVSSTTTIVGTNQTPPPAPNLNSVTVTQGSPTVSLMASNCSGTLTWMGPNGTSGNGPIQQATSTAGQFAYSARCTVGACVSPITSLTITVQAPTPSASVSISHLDGDNNPTNNIIRPYLQINNEGSSPVAYSQITVRYWLTAEDFSPLVNNLSVYWAQLGTSFVKMRYVPLGQTPRQGAFGYVEYRFEAGAGNLAAKSNSGSIQNGIGKNDWTNFAEGNDYSYAPNTSSYTKNAKITAYVNGQLVWGSEPPLIASLPANQSLKAYSESKNGPSTNTISTYVQVRNEGNVPLAYQTLKARYFFTTEGSQTVNFFLDYAQLGNTKVSGQVVRLPASGLPVSASANAYLELSFTGMGSDSLYPSSSTGSIQYRLAKSDNTNFDQSNDYSYQAVAPLALNPKMSVYLNGSKVYGSEPTGGSARLVVVENELSLTVTVLGNPVMGPEAQVEIRGAEGQTVNLRLIDLQGRSVYEQRIEQAGEVEPVSVPLGQSRGTLLLRVNTTSQQQVLKLIRP